VDTKYEFGKTPDGKIYLIDEVLIPKREFVIDNLLVRIHFIIVMIRWTGLAPWEFEIPFPGSLKSTFLLILKLLALSQSFWAKRCGEAALSFAPKVAGLHHR